VRGPKQHIPTRHLVGFMLGETDLTEEESDHLARCERCFAAMVKGTRQHLLELQPVDDKEERRAA
jgi:hypothetical protein